MKEQIPVEALEQMKREGWASMEEQRAYWEKKDIGGNVIPDRVQSNLQRYSHEEIEDFRTNAELDAIAEQEDTEREWNEVDHESYTEGRSFGHGESYGERNV